MAKRRRDESPGRQVLYEMVNGYLKENPVRNCTDVNALMRSLITPNMISETREPIIIEIDIAQKNYMPIMVTWNRMFSVTLYGLVEPKIVKN